MLIGEIHTVGKDGNSHEFRYETYDCMERFTKKPKICFKIFPIDDSYSDWFDFQVAAIPDNTIKVTNMFLDIKGFYKGKGIPEAMILEVQRLYPDKKIISSSNNTEVKQFLDEQRSEDASGVWERLVKKNLSHYSKDSDIYVLNPLK